MKSQALTEVAWRLTPDRQRAEAMGFRLQQADVYITEVGIELRGVLRCVCGRDEHYVFRVQIDPAVLDPARLLNERGAFSREHLVEDGYSAAEIDEILAKGAAYDVASR